MSEFKANGSKYWRLKVEKSQRTDTLKHPVIVLRFGIWSTFLLCVRGCMVSWQKPCISSCPGLNINRPSITGCQLNVAPALHCILRPRWGRQRAAGVLTWRSCSTGSPGFVCLDATRRGWRRVSHNGPVCSFVRQQKLGRWVAEEVGRRLEEKVDAELLSAPWAEALKPKSCPFCAPVY